jgi:hypothetical protein
MATTTNYSWSTPDDTALVKDGAAAIRSLGTAIDTTVFTNAGAAIAKATVDAKGDLIAGTADNTVARLAVGANDTVLVADSSTATGLKWAAPASGSTFVGANVTKTANQSISNATWTNVTWNNEQFDTNTFHDNSTNNTRMTIPSGKDGKYLITVGVVFDTNGSGVRHGMIKKNNVNYYKFNWDDSYGSERKSLNGSTTIECVATDYIEVEVYQSSGGALNVTGGGVDDGQFTITYLGA